MYALEIKPDGSYELRDEQGWIVCHCVRQWGRVECRENCTSRCEAFEIIRDNHDNITGVKLHCVNREIQL